MAGKKFPVVISFEGLDRLSNPLRRVNQRLEQFQAPFKRLNNQFDRFGKASGLATVASWATRGAVALAAFAVAGGYALKRVSDRATELGSNLNDVSKRTGFNTDALQNWGFALRQVGGSQEDLNHGITVFSKNLAMARRGQGPLVETLGRGNAFLNRLIRIKDVSKAFEYLITQLRSMPNEQNKILLNNAAFGKGMEEILGLTTMTNEELKKMFDKKLKLSPEDIKTLDDWGDKQEALADKFNVLTARAFVKLIPALSQALDKFEVFIDSPAFDRFVYVLEKSLPIALKAIEVVIDGLTYQLKPLTAAIDWYRGKTQPATNGPSLMDRVGGSSFLGIPGYNAPIFPQQRDAMVPALSTPSPLRPGAGGTPQIGLVVDFLNMPRGVRVQTKNPGKVDLDVNQGLSLLRP